MILAPTLKRLGFVCLLATAITSCQKEISDESGNVTPPPTTDCQLSKIIYYDSSGNTNDTAGLIYTNDKITRVNFTDYYINLVYANNRVNRINYFDYANTAFDFYDSVRYNGAGKIESLIFYYTGGGANEATGGYTISYNGNGTPSKITEKTSSGGPTLDDSYDYAYTYTGSNISKMTVTELQSSLTLAFNYTFDTNPNYFNSFPDEYIFADNVFFGISSLQFGLWSPFVFNANNVASMENAPVAYEKDANDNLSGIRIGGMRIIAYEYRCQ